MTSELIFDLAVTHRPQRTISSIERRRTGVDQPAPEVCSMSTMSLIPGSTCAGEQVLLRHRGRYHLARDSRAPRAVRGPVRAGELQRAMSGGGAERRGEQRTPSRWATPSAPSLINARWFQLKAPRTSGATARIQPTCGHEPVEANQRPTGDI